MSNSPVKALQSFPRATHVGSLLRPRVLFEKRSQLEEGKCSAKDLKDAEDIAVGDVLELQRSLGISEITDGEMKKASFFDGVFEKLEGMVYMPARPITEFKRYIPYIAMLYAAGAPTDATYYCNGKIKRTKPFYVEEFKALRSLVSPEEVKNIKVNMCPPAWWHHRHGSQLSYDLNVYKNDDEFFDALGVAYRAEFKELYELGCRNIQLDDPTFAFFCYDPTIEGMKAEGVDPDALLETYIRSVNVCTKDRPSDLKVGLHMCRGNYKGFHFCEGGYDRIAEKVFVGLDVDTLYLEYDDERSGSFEPLKHVPLNKTVVLGLVTTKNPKLENIDDLKRRVDEAATVMSQGNPKRSKEIALNHPQCGFASVWQGNPLTEEDQKNKLTLVVETAKQIWRDF
ncbi:hypothetical protein BDP27DRAFT_1211056 [Rhodocollybia butyracea]|uniref:Cobalamin-independent methionine synthase MetE C-terminal/archaeal domain-containing protein n=1 Tax=Rhodocollybia butyracea TaxID=206335 RepID=A0A9P5Q6V2_9AGAR|nr:hypothetical protein BDP27DRAFT_1211056 [Rhodocollybia butyracea]